MNYNDYYAQQAGGALPYFVGGRVQREHGLGRVFGGLLRRQTRTAEVFDDDDGFRA